MVVSRGQLVEIGGAFRIPDVMRKSGAKMVEVGTTNKTHLLDYEAAIGPDTALLLKVHTSNFQIVGFTEEVPLSDLVELGQKHDIPVMDDLGKRLPARLFHLWHDSGTHGSGGAGTGGRVGGHVLRRQASGGSPGRHHSGQKRPGGGHSGKTS